MGNTIFSSSTQTAIPTFKLKTSRSSYGDRSNGDKFSDVVCILYTYGASSCCIEIRENGVAKRAQKVETRVLDKDENSDNLVDASVTVTKHRSGMTVRSCNVKPGEGVIENWCDSRYWVQAIRYFSAQRYGLFALIRQIDEKGDVGYDEVSVQHYYATRSNKDGGFVVDVKIKYDGMGGGYAVEVEGPRAVGHGASFWSSNTDTGSSGTDDSDHDHIENETEGSVKVKVEGNGNPINGACDHNFINSGRQENRAILNSNGYTKGVANNSIFVYCLNFWRKQMDSYGTGLDASAHRALFLAPLQKQTFLSQNYHSDDELMVMKQ